MRQFPAYTMSGLLDEDCGLLQMIKLEGMVTGHGQ